MPEPEPAESTTARSRPRRLLIVANRTLAGAELAQAVQERLQAGIEEVLVVVPATHSESWRAQRYQWGMAGALGTPVPDLPAEDPEAERVARERLEAALERLREAGVVANGHVGDPDPMQAVSDVLATSEVAEVLISTLPAGISKWLGLDLPRRIERRFHLPVRQVTAKAEPAKS